MSISTNITVLKKRIQEALQKSADPSKKVQIIGVTKTIKPEKIQEAMDLGMNHLGENKVQELLTKYEAIGPAPQWHMIGHLQRNKVKYIVDKVSLIHSLDSLSLAEEINKRASKTNRTIDVLIQVNVSGEESKFGVEPNEAVSLAKQIESMNCVRIKGLMTMAPFTANTTITRDCFKRLFELNEKMKELKLAHAHMEYLSMGMSNDYDIALEEGSNMIRIGSAIFGNRKYD
ncbi:hypothetical protein SAMN05192551_107105 [Tindallia magadiensis]|uniref:Pyridoxal phosphate homeostasis protein n=1 Tax=Tindallia magadiensis TaxID=69895 RepID=A0A1I3FYS1_9FIRM|nr:YggS family pyridoxal phosphate-dependent enzyme [Tindallia magadiensis]SFI16222.1 hypothetical protein SAMN05192551_107105 [Tindallia magadiensis]